MRDRWKKKRSNDRPARLRVLLISSKYHPEYAGSGLRVQRLYNRLREKNDLDVEILCGCTLELPSRVYFVDGLRVTRIAPSIWLRKWKQSTICQRSALIRKVSYLLEYRESFIKTFAYFWHRKRSIDLVHIVGRDTVTLSAITFTGLFRKPCLLEFVNQIDNAEYWSLKRLLSRRVTEYPKNVHFVSLSPSIVEKCVEAGIQEERIWLRPNPIDEKKFYYKKHKQSHLGSKLTQFSDGQKVLLYLAKFGPLKNQLFLIEVLNRLPPEYCLILAGPLELNSPDGSRDLDYFSRIEARIDLYQLQQRTMVVREFIHRPDQFMTVADVFVMPTLKEAFGTPVYESIATGTPVVCQNLPGVFEEYVIDGSNGFLVPMTIDAWRTAIFRAISIEKDCLMKASVQIRKLAGNLVVDNLYLNKLRSLGLPSTRSA